MRYVDLRRRRHETGSPEPTSPRKEGPYPLLALGFVLGVIVSFLFYAGGAGPVGGLLLLIATGAGRLPGVAPDRTPPPEPENGRGEAIQDAGGSITPVEAALKTSLTVDEAEQILTRFADRGHLLIQSRDGALRYAMPGGRPY